MRDNLGMINYRCDAAIGFHLESDAVNEQQIIELADSLSQIRWNGRLDSLDLGDAMGAFIRAAVEDFYNGDLDSIFMGNGFFVRMEMNMELFQWNK